MICLVCGTEHPVGEGCAKCAAARAHKLPGGHRAQPNVYRTKRDQIEQDLMMRYLKSGEEISEEDWWKMCDKAAGHLPGWDSKEWMKEKKEGR